MTHKKYQTYNSTLSYQKKDSWKRKNKNVKNK